MSNDSAALAGWAMNPNAPVDQRLACARQALNFYVNQQDQLYDLLAYCQGMSDGNESGDAREAYDDAAARLTAILDGPPAGT